MVKLVERTWLDHTILDVRLAVLDDIDGVKRLADVHRHELGFVVRASLVDACQRGGLFVASLIPRGALQSDKLFDHTSPRIVGFVQAHFRRDGQATLHTITVDAAYRHQGIGRILICVLTEAARIRQMRCILLRCPIDLEANAFYASLGFHRERIEPGKRRELAVWMRRVCPDESDGRVPLQSNLDAHVLHVGGDDLDDKDRLIVAAGDGDA